MKTETLKNQIKNQLTNDIQSAAGNDRLSKSEQAQLKGVAAKAAEQVRKKTKKGGHVMVEDVIEKGTKIANSAIDRVNQKAGEGQKTFSQVELRNLKSVNKAVQADAKRAFEAIGEYAILPKSKRESGAAVFEKLAALVPGQNLDGQLGSEGGEPIVAFRKANAQATKIDAETIDRVLGLDESTPLEEIERVQDIEDLFQDLIDSHSGGDEALDMAATVKLMRENLSSLKVAIVGRDGDGGPVVHPTYIVGVSKDGDVVGIKSSVVWT